MKDTILWEDYEFKKLIYIKTRSIRLNNCHHHKTLFQKANSVISVEDNINYYVESGHYLSLKHLDNLDLNGLRLDLCFKVSD